MRQSRLIKQAFLMMLQHRRKDSWPNQVQNILDRVGLGNCWNEGKGIGEMTGTVSRLFASRLESQEVQIWQAEKATSPSLGIYVEVKQNWGGQGEIYLKMGLVPDDLKWVMYVRGNFMPIGERRKYLGRNRLRMVLTDALCVERWMSLCNIF